MICWRCDGNHTQAECTIPSRKVQCSICKKNGHLAKWHTKWEELKAFRAKQASQPDAVCYRCGGAHQMRDCKMRRTSVKCEKCQVVGHKTEFCDKVSKVCYRCGKADHVIRVCPVPVDSVTCSFCGSKGHMGEYCSQRPKGQKSLQAAIEERGRCSKCGDTGHSAAECIGEKRVPGASAPAPSSAPASASDAPRPPAKSSAKAPAKEGESASQCFVCGKTGHGLRDCPLKEKLAQKCTNCGQFRHVDADCRLSKVVRD